VVNTIILTLTLPMTYAPNKYVGNKILPKILLNTKKKHGQQAQLN
jgi:hypothetical protein